MQLMFGCKGLKMYLQFAHIIRGILKCRTTVLFPNSVVFSVKAILKSDFLKTSL